MRREQERERPFSSSQCGVIYIQTDFQLSEGTSERTNQETNERESRRQGWKGGGIGRGSVRDRDSSLGSHVLSQFAVPRPPSPFFAPVLTGSTTGPRALRRRVVFPAPPRGNHVPHEYFCAKKKACSRTRAHAESPSRVKRPVHLDARGPSCGPRSAVSRRWSTKWSAAVNSMVPKASEHA